MTEYHVGCGLAGIYAGTFRKPGEWKDKSECTDEAIGAVFEYMLDKAAENGSDWCIYDGETVKGRKVRMTVQFMDGEEDGDL